MFTDSNSKTDLNTKEIEKTYALLFVIAQEVDYSESLERHRDYCGGTLL